MFIIELLLLSVTATLQISKVRKQSQADGLTYTSSVKKKKKRERAEKRKEKKPAAPSFLLTPALYFPQFMKYHDR